MAAYTPSLSASSRAGLQPAPPLGFCRLIAIGHCQTLAAGQELPFSAASQNSWTGG